MGQSIRDLGVVTKRADDPIIVQVVNFRTIIIEEGRCRMSLIVS